MDPDQTAPLGLLCLSKQLLTNIVYPVLGVRDITGIPVYLDLGVLRYVSRYAFDVPVHSTNSVNFRSIVYLLLFLAVFYLHVNIYFTLLDN